MLILICEGSEFNFEATLFEETIKEQKITDFSNKIISIDGILSINGDFTRKGIQVRGIDAKTISETREKAKQMSML
jgi:hypothetical protein